ncbi:MAG: hypothetical protein ABH871_02400 [Pseudomonadota bacterium]
MKTIVALLVAIMATVFFASAAVAKHAELQGKDAKLHQIVSDDPGSVQVISPYSKAIKLKRLGKNDVAYWHPDGGKYIVAGDYAYVWCKVYNTKSNEANFHWVAVNTSALNEALNLRYQFATGVAFYKLSSQSGKIIFEAFPYDTVRAISEGKDIINVKE